MKNNYSQIPDYNPPHASVPDATSVPIKPSFTLRISITEHCNFRCKYCLPDGMKIKPDYTAPPPLEELVKLVQFLNYFGSTKKVKITGGEPLVRKGVGRLVDSLMNSGIVEEVSMTTNGSLLARYAKELRSAGLKRVNVSLDTIDPTDFKMLSGVTLKDTLHGIEAALEAGLTPLKLNSVLRKSSWRQDVPDLLDYAAQMKVELRFIELMQTGSAASWAMDEYISASSVIEWLTESTDLEYTAQDSISPARMQLIKWNGKQVKVGWITPQSQPFCDDCRRLRIDCYGRLRRCLIDPQVLPLLELIKNSDLTRALNQTDDYLRKKTPPREMKIEDDMAVVGG